MGDNERDFKYQEFEDFVYLNLDEVSNDNVISTAYIKAFEPHLKYIGSVKIGFLKDFDKNQKEEIIQEIGDLKFPSHTFRIVEFSEENNTETKV